MFALTISMFCINDPALYGAKVGQFVAAFHEATGDCSRHDTQGN